MKQVLLKNFLLLLTGLIFVSPVFGQIQDPSRPANSNPNELEPFLEELKVQFNSAPILNQAPEDATKKMTLDSNRIGEMTPEQIRRKAERDSIFKALAGKADVDKEFANALTLYLDSVRGLPPATVIGQEYFRLNNLSVFDKTSTDNLSENYVLGPGDEISVIVYGYSQFVSKKLRVEEDGAIFVNVIGKIYVKGLTLANARKAIVSAFATTFNVANSSVEVNVASSRNISVNIVGEVFKPGTYTLPAINTAFNALFAAGGPNQNGSVRSIIVKRSGKVVDSLDIYQFMKNPYKVRDVFLQTGDYLIVMPQGKVVELSGDVKKPGRYELKNGENIKSLLLYSDGLTPSSFAKLINIQRWVANDRLSLFNLNLDTLLRTNKDFGLANGDRILIRSIPTNFMNTVEVTGSVNVPGEYELAASERISDLIAKANGISLYTYKPRAYITRLNNDLTYSLILVELEKILTNPEDSANFLLKRGDVLRVFSQMEFLDRNKVYIYGEVRNPGSMPYMKGMTLKDALLVSGGMTFISEYNRVEVARIVNVDAERGGYRPALATVYSLNIGRDLYNDQVSEGIEIYPDDQVFVRRDTAYRGFRNIVLNGEVKYPGVYAIKHDGEKIADLIGRAGGFTALAFPEAASIERTYDTLGFLYMNLPEAMKRPSSKFNYILAEGDVITVPRMRDFVTLTGNINDPLHKQLSVPYFGGKRAKFYIKNYGGGFAPNTKKKLTLVTYPSGITKKTRSFLFFRIYPKVKKGSVIKVQPKPIKPKRDHRFGENFWSNYDRSLARITAMVPLLTMIILALK